MKILHIIPNFGKGGAERLVLDICNNLSKQKDCEVTLITFRDDNSYSFLINELDWKVIPSSVQLSISGKSIIDVQQLQDYIDTFQPDVIHSHLFETEMVLAYISLPIKIFEPISDTKLKRSFPFLDKLFTTIKFNSH